MPSIFLTPSKPRGPRTGDTLIEQESITPAEGSGLRPWAWRTWVLQLTRSRSQVPSRVQRRKCLWVADQETAPVVERIRQVPPVWLTYKIAATYSRRRHAEHGRPLFGLGLDEQVGGVAMRGR
jgi:hypothetical protein